MVTLVPILGGLVSGFVGGVMTVELRARREQRISEKQWYEQTQRLAQRVNRAQQRRYEESEAIYARNTCAGVLGQLTTHLMNAPPRVSDDLLEKMDEFTFHLETIRSKSANSYSNTPNKIKRPLTKADRVADEVVDLAENAKQSIPIL